MSTVPAFSNSNDASTWSPATSLCDSRPGRYHISFVFRSPGSQAFDGSSGTTSGSLNSACGDRYGLAS
jgi:hypothetical protein